MAKSKAEQVDIRIQNTIATPFASLTASVLANELESFKLPKDEFLAFVERNLNEYNKTVLEALGDIL